MPNQFLGLREADRAPSLATDLNDPAILAGRLDDLESLLDLMSHRLFAVDVFTSVTGVHDDLLMPVIGHGNDHAINVLVVEQVPVATRGGHRLARRCADDLVGERLAVVMKVARSHTFDTREPHRSV